MEEGWSSVSKVCSIWCLLYLVSLGEVGAGEITCHAIRYTFLQKNLDISDVPKTTQQGEIYTQYNHAKFHSNSIKIAKTIFTIKKQHPTADCEI